MNIHFILTFIFGSSFIAENKLESACRWSVGIDSLCFLCKEAMVDGFCGSVIQLSIIFSTTYFSHNWIALYLLGVFRPISIRDTTETVAGNNSLVTERTVEVITLWNTLITGQPINPVL